MILNYEFCSVNLSEATVGIPLKLIDIKDNKLKLRLFELGCLPGCAIVVEHQTPMNDPIVLYFEDMLLALRKSEAQSVEVEVWN